MISFLLLAGGLFWMARGLEALVTGTPSMAARRGARMAIVLGVAVVAVELFARLSQILRFNYADYADGGQDGAILIANVMGLSYVLVPLAWSYAARALLRAGGDTHRSPQAVRLGTAAGWLAIVWLGTSVAGVALLPFAMEADLASGEQTTLGAIAYVLAVAGATMALAAIATLVAALANGLGARDPGLAELGDSQPAS
jgi:hypothetical protein